MNVPTDIILYRQVKKEADKIYMKPSAYKSGYIVKKYKSLGGNYTGKKSTEGLTSWFREDWKDVATHKMPDGTIMLGATHGASYPVYRPTKRVNKNTPLLVSEIDPKNLKKQIKLKQKIKGNSNLPPFIEK